MPCTFTGEEKIPKDSESHFFQSKAYQYLLHLLSCLGKKTISKLKIRKADELAFVIVFYLVS